MVLGGVLTEFLGWRWVLLVNVPVALAVLALAPLAVPESRSEGAPRTLDVPGAVTATVGLVVIIYALSEAPNNGWSSTVELGLAAAIAAVIAASAALGAEAGGQAAVGALRLGMLAEVVFVALALFLVLFLMRGEASPKEPDA
jgi:hypothetical protein